MPSVSSMLYPGSRFSGFQQSGSHQYPVEVILQTVDLPHSYICGYLEISNLTPEYPKLTTFFEGEIIQGDRFSFHTSKWDADDAVDCKHWGLLLASCAASSHHRHHNHHQIQQNQNHQNRRHSRSNNTSNHSDSSTGTTTTTTISDILSPSWNRVSDDDSDDGSGGHPMTTESPPPPPPLSNDSPSSGSSLSSPSPSTSPSPSPSPSPPLLVETSLSFSSLDPMDDMEELLPFASTTTPSFSRPASHSRSSTTTATATTTTPPQPSMQLQAHELSLLIAKEMRFGGGDHGADNEGAVARGTESFRSARNSSSASQGIYAQLRHSDFMFMRWKEHFLVPDHKIKSVSGASFAGFYYICFFKRMGEIEGFYYHHLSDPYQHLHLKHVPRRTFPTFEFR